MSSVRRPQREPLAILVGATFAALLVAYLTSGSAAAYWMAGLSAALPVVLIALATRPSARRRRLALGLLVLLGLLEAAGLGIVALAGRGEGLGGYPPGLLLLLAGLWAVPLLVSGLVFALTFDDFLP